MEFKNIFSQGKMDQDSDSRLVPPGVYREALNLHVSNSSQDDKGVLENSLSNRQLTDFALGTNPRTVGGYVDQMKGRLYWWGVSDSGQSWLCEYNTITSVGSIVLLDSRIGPGNVLNLQRFNLITGAAMVIDSDNDLSLLGWTDNINEPRLINVDRAKTYGENNFTQADISLIKAPPISCPIINLSTTTGTQGQENNIKEEFFRFSTRYVYLDGEVSAPSPFTNVGFLPTVFNYDYSIQSNESMVNAFNQVDIAFNTGPSTVVAVDVLFKSDNSNTIYLIDTYNKSEQGWTDDQVVSVEFNNSKNKGAIDANQLFRISDRVPRMAQAMELIGNRFVFANYTEDFDIIDNISQPVAIDFTLAGISSSISNLTPTPTLKSNRDYEVYISYLDSFGRITTPLTPVGDNTIHFSNVDSVTQNQIQVTINNDAPAFAQHYRFFIKQTRTDYDTITASVFYTEDNFVWILLQGNESSKVEEGDFIYVKADTQQVLNPVLQTRVLEIKLQDADFLDNGESQFGGTYMRIKPNGFNLNESDYQLYDFSAYDSSANADNDPLRSLAPVIEPAVYYGLAGLDDLTSGGAYVGSDDIRYIVEIDGTGPDTFRWSDDDGASWVAGVAITGAAQTLNNGVQVTFGATTGHALTDSWIVSAKAANANDLGQDENSKAYGFFKSFPSNGNINQDDVIPAGAQITLTYREFNNVNVNFEQTYISTRQYANLEEWWFGDNIQGTFFRPENEVWFRRGTMTSNFGAKYFTLDATGDMVLIVRSVGTQNNDLDSQVKLDASISISSLAQPVIFETIPEQNNNAFPFEIGRTYEIDNTGNHLGFPGTTDVSQAGTGTSAVITLDTFNAFAWGNGFESYKIKDLFNATNFKTNTRPLATTENYRKNIRIASLTYGDVYEQSTNFNGLNEFNAAVGNFKDMDDALGSIQKLHARDTNLIVLQEDKVHRLPYLKDILFDATGDPNVTESTSVLGTAVAYAGNYGISKNPESFATYGNSIYFTDVKRAVVCRLDLNGIIEISANGMEDFFQDAWRALPSTKKIGAYDLDAKQYVLSVDQTVTPTDVPRFLCGTTVEFYQLLEETSYEVSFTPSSGNLELNYDVSGTINVSLTEDTLTTDLGDVSGTGTLNYNQNNDTSVVTLTITPVSEAPSFDITVPCPTDPIPAVVANDDEAFVTQGQSLAVNELANDTFADIDDLTVSMVSPPTRGAAVVNADKTIQYTNNGLTDDNDSFVYQITDGLTSDTATVTCTVSSSSGPPPGEGTEFDISTDSYFSPTTSGQGACGFVLDDNKWHDGAWAIPTLADTVYNEVTKNTTFNGQNKYYRIANGRAIKIATNGLITDLWICGGGNA